jgi:hypothetical protein
MIGSSTFPASVIRAPSPTAACTCEHWVHCDHPCHGRRCDPTENSCDLAFVPDEGGLTRWGCIDCTPGEGTPHFLGCELERAGPARSPSLSGLRRARLGVGCPRAGSPKVGVALRLPA